MPAKSKKEHSKVDKAAKKKTAHKEEKKQTRPIADVRAFAIRNLAKCEPVVTKADQKGGPMLVTMVASPSDREFARGALGTKPYAVHLQIASANTGSSGAAQTVVQTVDPVAAADFPAFAQLFDEVRTTSATAHVWQHITSGSGQTTLTPLWSIMFDPAAAAAPISVLEAVTHTRHVGPMMQPNLAAYFASTLVGYGGMRATGVPISTGKLQPIIYDAGASAVGSIGSSWISTSSTAATAGYIKVFAEANGGTVTSRIRMIVVLHCEFRMRSGL